MAENDGVTAAVGAPHAPGDGGTALVEHGGTPDDGAPGDTGHEGGIKDEARAKAEEVKDRARAKAEEIKDEVREKARDVRNEAERKARRWSGEAGQRAGGLARALRSASDTLRAEGDASLADLAGQAADNVDRLGGYLENEDPSAMLHDLEDMGRRNPGTFVGSTFAVGLLLGRFLRSSSPAPEGSHDHDDLPARVPEDVPPGPVNGGPEPTTGAVDHER